MAVQKSTKAPYDERMVEKVQRAAEQATRDMHRALADESAAAGRVVALEEREKALRECVRGLEVRRDALLREIKEMERAGLS